MVHNVRRTLPIVGGGALILIGAGLVAFLIAGPQQDRVATGSAGAEAPERSQGAQAPAGGDADASAAEDDPPNAIARQAREWGISRCSREIALVSDFLTRNSVFSARSMRGPRDADGEVFSATIVARARDDGMRTLSTMSVAPVSAGGCNVVYETTAHFPADCDSIRQARFANFAEPMELGGLAQAYATAEGDGELYMLPTGTGCLVKKTQSLY